jgi:DNA repair protein RadA/Sms
MTKGGDVAGPRVLEHLVDAVLLVEGEEGLASGGNGASGFDGGSMGTTASGGAHRLVRATKNRFGSTSELGLFLMTDAGFVEASPSLMFLSQPEGQEGEERRTGCAVAGVLEGTRALSVEVQALVTRSLGAYPRHRAMGIGHDRLHLAWAVLNRHTPLRLSNADILANVVGGLRVTDPGADLAVAAAMASSATSAPLPARTLFVGELGLGGELRAPSRLQDRLRAAAKVGFTSAIVGASSGSRRESPASVPGLRVLEARTLSAALGLALGPTALSSTAKARGHQPGTEFD